MAILVAVGVLIAINSWSFVQEEERSDSELAPNRSTYNARATGTRAFYDLLSESGYKVMRWREPPDQLLGDRGGRVGTFVLIGVPRVPFEEEEAETLLHWVARGGRLVIIDRGPEDYLLPRSGDWSVTTDYLAFSDLGIDPWSSEQMTKGMDPIRPSQPTSLTGNVESVMPSRYFSSIRFSAAEPDSSASPSPVNPGARRSPKPSPPSPQDLEGLVSALSPAPVVHLIKGATVLLVDYPHGRGRVILLSDPYIVSNGGIALKDNLQLAINLVSGSDGLIAFDEFHQGRAEAQNAFAGYFAGTPVLAIFGQVILLVLLILWTRGRRFARPVPLPAVDRRSSLEFVASMAELQERARAFDLAIENIYSRTRRVLARYAGLDYNSSRSQIAERVAARSSLDAHQLSTLMRQAEEAINGAAISERQSVQLVKRLREVERSLGLRMRSREVKQAAENI